MDDRCIVVDFANQRRSETPTHFQSLSQVAAVPAENAAGIDLPRAALRVHFYMNLGGTLNSGVLRETKQDI
jgi:hypothetical protein